jgi:uncharacterized protein DUF6362
MKNYSDTTVAFERVKEAADTLRRLPSAMMKNKLTYWPEVVQNSANFMHSDMRPKLAAASPAAITRLDQTLDQLIKLSQKERRLVWCRALGISWRKLEGMEGLSHVTLRKYVNQGLGKMV